MQIKEKKKVAVTVAALHLFDKVEFTFLSSLTLKEN